MNFFLLASIISLVFLLGKMGLSYKDINPKACVQDAVLVFASSALGLYGYDKYAAVKTTVKHAEVFTEKPNF
jgi:hypothetical protein